jgi:hypothetical protein
METQAKYSNTVNSIIQQALNLYCLFVQVVQHIYCSEGNTNNVFALRKPAIQKLQNTCQ